VIAAGIAKGEPIQRRFHLEMCFPTIGGCSGEFGFCPYLIGAYVAPALCTSGGAPTCDHGTPQSTLLSILPSVKSWNPIVCSRYLITSSGGVDSNYS